MVHTTLKDKYFNLNSTITRLIFKHESFHSKRQLPGTSRDFHWFSSYDTRGML